MAVIRYLRNAALVLAVQQVVVAQQCYYPNGSQAPDSEKPCSSAEGSACCPDKWECMDNGLCYYEPDKLYGRYSCTDKDWESSGCPSNLCTYDMKAVGGEAITQCSNHDNKWCCDANRVDVDCCQESPEPRPFFMLQDPVAYGTAGSSTGSSAPNLASITGKATGSGDDSSSSTTAPSNSASSKSISSMSPSTPVTSVSTSVSSGSAGPSTLIVTTIIQPAASSTNSASPSPTSGKKSNVPVIVGCAVGIPLALALLGILIWLFRKRAHQKSTNPPYTSSTDAFTPTPATPEFTGGAKFSKGNGATRYESTDPGVPELAGGQGVGPERPVSMIQGKAELDSGTGFAPGTTPVSPHLVGVGGGTAQGWNRGHTPQTSLGSVPEGYSPAQYQGPWQPNTGGAIAGAGGDPNTGRYVAYRPPVEGAGAGAGLHNVPEMAELPTVRTPPEVAELGNPSPPERGRAEYPGMMESGTRTN